MVTPAVIGIDIGGSGVRMRAQSEDAACEHKAAWSDADPLADLRTLRRLAERVLGGVGCPTAAAAVVAFPGTLDDAGAVTRWPTRPDWNGVLLGELLATSIGVTPLIADDAVLAAHAEALAATQAGAGSLFYLGLGSGVGGAFVSRGCTRLDEVSACEAGHMIVFPGAPELCECGRGGCLQAYASGHAAERLEAAVGRRAAQELAIRALAIALSNVAELLGPDRIVIGGGFASARPEVVTLVGRALDGWSRTGTRVPAPQRAAHGPRSSLMGAVLAAQAIAEHQPLPMEART